MEQENFIYGRNSVTGYLEQKPGHIGKIYIRESAQGSIIDRIKQLASEHRIPVQFVPGKKLYDMVGKVNDQGIVAQITPLQFIDLEDWLEHIEIENQPIVLILDQIEDVQNFGAILRTAAAVNAAGVIISKHRQNPLTSAVYKASAGTAGLVPVVRVVNLNQAIIKLKKTGFWIAGLDQNSEYHIWNEDLNIPLAVVIGSEDKGIRKKTLEHCDLRLAIPMAEGVESLNASVSAAVFSYEVFRQKRI